MTLPTADAIAEQLRACERGEVIALLVPHQRQDDRARAIRHFDGVVSQVRAAGWRVRTGLHPSPNGDAFSIEPLAEPEGVDATCP